MGSGSLLVSLLGLFIVVGEAGGSVGLRGVEGCGRVILWCSLVERLS